MKPIRRGSIVAAFGRHYEILLDSGETATGYPRGKKSELACGDIVTINTDGQIVGHEARHTLLHRSDAYRQKLIAANATQLVMVVATEPSFNDTLLSRALVAAECQEMRTLIVLNKADLSELLPAARATLAPFAALGYPVIELCAKQDVSALAERLEGETSVLVGQSGMGKSTLTNAFIPLASAATREISTALDSGKHTTTCTRVYALQNGLSGRLIDSPGLQEFGLAHLTRNDIESAFREFRPLLGHCKYRDCLHLHEPECAVKTAAQRGEIHPRRLEHFHQLIASLPR
jgi:ribosome biogenesis GTPase